MKGSLVILSFFAVGLLLGVYRLVPTAWLGNEYSLYVLGALIFAVGFSLGHQPNSIKEFRRIDSKILLLPIVTIVGTWLGVIVLSFFSEHSVFDYLAVGSGFGYYSLSSVLITQYKGLELGTIALLANIFREIITLLFAPLLAKYFGRLAPISAGGATSMDSTFPIIVRTSGKEYAVVAIYHGFVVDFCVPFLVVLWCLKI